MTSITFTILGEPASKANNRRIVYDTRLRWIMCPKDEDFGFCGAPVKSESSFCEAHHAICFTRAAQT